MALSNLQVVTEFGPHGGAEVVSWELARAWDRAQVPNSVMSCKFDPSAPAGKVKQVASFLAGIPTRGAMRYLGRLVVVLGFTLAASIALRRRPVEIVISHGDTLTGDILVLHALNIASLAAKRGEGNWLWRFNPMHVLVAARDRYMIGGRRYRKYVAVSLRVKNELMQYYNVPDDQIRIIPNAIDVDRFKRDANAGAAVRKELNIPADAKLLLFVGHEFGRKGLAFVIGALEHLPEDTWLLVVGADAIAPFEKLAAKWRDRIVFAGERRDMPALYSAADALVLPSYYETFLLVGLEAMAAGMPIFATNVGGIEEYLIDGVNGFRITRDAEAIAASVGPVLQDRQLYHRLCLGALETAGKYSWNQSAREYVMLCEEIMAEKYTEGAKA